MHFAPSGAFHRDLKQAVDTYFSAPSRRRNDLVRMYVKTAVIVGWFAASWILLVFFAASVWTGLALSVSLGLAVAGIGMAIQHDANHGATSQHSAVNVSMGWILDAMGASSFVWRQKHNILHHTFTNIHDVDDDISVGPLARLAPSQHRYSWHRWQHVYFWVLYGFLLPKWVFYDDFANLVTGRIGSQRMTPPHVLQLGLLLGGKVLFVAWMIIVPALFHPLWQVLLFGLLTCFTVGVTLAVTFQLAHCVEEADFPLARGKRIDRDWAAHQMATTVDFARNNWLLSWYLGGLNFQVEHHLFPRVCHLHYRALSGIVERIAGEHGIRYRENPSLRGAVRSHYRWLRRLGASQTLDQR